MRPVETPDTNFTYKLPGGTEENDLPCVVTTEPRDASAPDPGPKRGTTTSFWDVEPDDDLDAAEGIYVQVDNPQWLWVEIGFGDSPDGLTIERRDLTPYDGGGQTNVPLTDEIKKWLRAGGHFVLRIGSHPTPPVSVWLA